MILADGISFRVCPWRQENSQALARVRGSESQGRGRRELIQRDGAAVGGDAGHGHGVVRRRTRAETEAPCHGSKYSGYKSAEELSTRRSALQPRHMHLHDHPQAGWNLGSRTPRGPAMGMKATPVSSPPSWTTRDLLGSHVGAPPSRPSSTHGPGKDPCLAPGLPLRSKGST